MKTSHIEQQRNESFDGISSELARGEGENFSGPNEFIAGAGTPDGTGRVKGSRGRPRRFAPLTLPVLSGMLQAAMKLRRLKFSRSNRF